MGIVVIEGSSEEPLPPLPADPCNPNPCGPSQECSRVVCITTPCPAYTCSDKPQPTLPPVSVTMEPLPGTSIDPPHSDDSI